LGLVALKKRGESPGRAFGGQVNDKRTKEKLRAQAQRGA
jgi:hypothetical protein